ncbi:DNA polymerase beta domain-containing protein region [Candidatus Magnetoovum chiemensis]|nr:DNA polymerase beta domain-containing protein region [Candidatus Magnetoovum chiemensis]
MKYKDIQIIKELKSLILQRISLCQIMAFGSRAREDADEYSDLDVLIVVNSIDRQTERFISDCAWQAGFAKDVVIMPIVLTSDALKNSPLRESVLIKTVYSEGIAL